MFMHRLVLVAAVAVISCSAGADTIFVDDDPVEIGDPVVLFGEGHPVEDVAEAAGTIPYELLVGISGRVPRVLQA